MRRSCSPTKEGGVAIEVDADIFVHQQVHGIAVIRQQSRQESQGLRLETIYRALPYFSMRALVGGFSEPLARLAIDII